MNREGIEAIARELEALSDDMLINDIDIRIGACRDPRDMAADLRAIAPLPLLEGWRDIGSAPRSDDENAPLLVLQEGRRFVAEWDPCAGQWQGIAALDGVEREAYFQEWPGKLYGVTAWSPLPSAPSLRGDLGSLGPKESALHVEPEAGHEPSGGVE